MTQKVKGENFESTSYLYIDFEADTRNQFYQVGYSFGAEVSQVVLNEGLKDAAKAHNLKVCDPREFARTVLQEAFENEMTIVAYSEAERNYLRDLVGPNELEKFRSISYLNLARASKKWIRKYHSKAMSELGEIYPSKFKKRASKFRRRQLNNSLVSRARLVGFPPPPQYAPGRTTSRFNAVLDGLAAKSSFQKLTRTQKSKWTKVLSHNRFDVEALPFLLNGIRSDDEGLLTESTIPLFC